MLELLGILFPILLIDVLNPVLLALLVFAAGSNRPVVNSSAFLLGHTLAYFLSGIVFSFGVEKIAARLENPQAIDFAISALLGVACIYFALKPTAAQKHAEITNMGLTPLKCLGFGAVVNFLGTPFALPYIGAVDQILKADLSLQQNLVALTIYNVGYALPFTVVPVAVLVMGERAKPFLQRMNYALLSLTDKFMPWALLLLGLWLLFDAGYYTLTGEVLI